LTALGSRVSMRHRCKTQRRTGAGHDSWGQDSDAWVDYLTNLPCRAWDVSGQLVITAGELATVDSRHLAFPLGTDILQTDRIGDVTYRGAVILNGYQTIDDLTIWPDRIEVTLRRSGG
jgi:hypothetical protein